MTDRLRTSEEELSAIYMNVPGILFYIAIEPDGDFRFQSVSREFLVATGLTRQQIVGTLVRDVIPPPSLGMVLDRYREAIRTGQPVRWEEESVYPAGRKYGEVAVTPLRDANGIATHLIGIVHDITERKRTEEERAEGDQRKNDFLSLPSHELRDPLAAVSSLADRRCTSCGSDNLGNLSGELALHFRGLQNIDKPAVFVFQDVVVCLDCGASNFQIPEERPASEAWIWVKKVRLEPSMSLRMVAG